MTSTVDTTGILGLLSASGSSASPNGAQIMEFTSFNNLRNYTDHQEQILSQLPYEAYLYKTDQKSGDELLKLLLWSLPPAILF